MEIKVAVPDAFAAFALCSFLNAPEQISYPVLLDGSYVVFIHQVHDLSKLKERVRLWADLQEVGELELEIDGEPRLSEDVNHDPRGPAERS